MNVSTLTKLLLTPLLLFFSHMHVTDQGCGRGMLCLPHCSLYPQCDWLGHQVSGINPSIDSTCTEAECHVGVLETSVWWLSVSLVVSALPGLTTPGLLYRGSYWHWASCMAVDNAQSLHDDCRLDGTSTTLCNTNMSEYMDNQWQGST